MSQADDPFRAYSAEILSFSLAGRPSAEPLPPPDPALTKRRAETLERMLGDSSKAGLVLLGVGIGALVAELAGRMGSRNDLVVCDLSPERVREALASGLFDPAPIRLFVDASPWAHLVFLAGRGLTAETSLFAVNPEGTAAERQEHAALQKTWLAASPRRIGPVLTADGSRFEAAWNPGEAMGRPCPTDALAPAIPAAPPGQAALAAADAPAGLNAPTDSPASTEIPAMPSLAAAAILHPDEPGLEAFFAALPSFVAEVVLVWDQPEDAPLPRRDAISRLPAAARLTEIRRPLAADFAAQRNAMLDTCTADWVLYLDGDERLAPGDWERAAALAASGLAEAWLLPRLTFWPEASRAQVGYGLWPDPQLRLFRRRAGLRFERPVHERLTGLPGPLGLALDLPILHESYLRKDRERIEAKLRVFDQAGGGALSHRRCAGYPNLPAGLLQPPVEPGSIPCLLLGSLPRTPSR